MISLCPLSCSTFSTKVDTVSLTPIQKFSICFPIIPLDMSPARVFYLSLFHFSHAFLVNYPVNNNINTVNPTPSYSTLRHPLVRLCLHMNIKHTLCFKKENRLFFSNLALSLYMNTIERNQSNTVMPLSLKWFLFPSAEERSWPLFQRLLSKIELYL